MENYENPCFFIESVQKHEFSLFQKVSREIWMCISSTPSSYVQAYSVRGEPDSRARSRGTSCGVEALGTCPVSASATTPGSQRPTQCSSAYTSVLPPSHRTQSLAQSCPGFFINRPSLIPYTNTYWRYNKIVISSYSDALLTWEMQLKPAKTEQQ